MPRSTKALLSGAAVMLALSLALNVAVLNLAADSAYAGRVSVSFDELQLIKDALGLIRVHYVDDAKLEKQNLLHGAIEGMITRLDDPYSRFMPPQNYKEMTDDTRGRFGGLGMYIGERNKRPSVIAPIPDTPAWRAGVQSGDYIIKVDDRDVTRMPIEDIAKLLRGPPGTKVKVAFYREGAKGLRELTLERAEVKTPTVRAGLVDPSIGYVALQNFSATTAENLDRLVAQFEGRGVRSLILDLRQNPGGLLEAAVMVGRVFLSDCRIVTVKSRTGDEVPYNAFGSHHRKLPLVVIVDGGSASAAEIVAGAVKDNRRGILVGTRTFGKGSVQTVLELADKSALALTTAYYYTPAGTLIHKSGIEPHVKIEMPTLDEKLRKEFSDQREEFWRAGMQGSKDPFSTLKVPQYDQQLLRAVDILRGSALFYDKLLQGQAPSR